ncbi:copper chaperone CopZ [Sediminihabitans luteus]|uniref:Copper chaperone CopZ n=1 Tax=Sediminihabitans luteus TaxID=1138585 RepID=A0A2M9D0V3_9CELL|nr:heavy metal-associated domain-containing protein [Sediminihabitans luteus]PJJ77767.1 copper chaperone CopZ [Sediminihabitans luteus]GIJ00006.1 hypothetical protein Slu03_23830 [Sediminihabitans luteus]
MTTVTTLGITGMTCGACVEHVTSDLGQVAGVESVSVELRVGQASRVTVTSDDPLDEAELREAVDESGYGLASLAVQVDAESAQAAAQAAEREAAEAAGGGCCGGGCCGGDASAPEPVTYDPRIPRG